MQLVYVFLFITAITGIAARIVTNQDPQPGYVWMVWVALGISLIPSTIFATLKLMWFLPAGIIASLVVAFVGYHYREIGTGLAGMLKQPRWLFWLIVAAVGGLIIWQWPDNQDFQADVFRLVLLTVLVVFGLRNLIGFPKKKKTKS